MGIEELLNSFYAEVSDQYPELTKKQIEDICRSPFEFVRERMKSTVFPEIRLQNFGVFKVRVKNAERRLAETKMWFLAGKIPQQTHDYYVNSITKFLEKHESKNKS